MLLLLRLALGCAAALTLLPAGSAAAAGLHAPSDAHAPARPFAAPLRDDVIASRAGAARASAARAFAAQGQRFYSTDGQGPIRVELSRSYGELRRDTVQPFVDFVASRLHGPELPQLTLVILTPDEVRRACSETALACYVPKLQAMIVPGEQTPMGEVSLEYVITHEYGHHIAANRANDPWTVPFPKGAGAALYGPKRWASYEGVCAGVRAGRYFPGDEKKNYRRNPGENWAEAYAQERYRGQFPWQFDPSLAPDDGAFAAIAADVTDPWRRNVSQRRSGRLSRARRARSFGVQTTLDGRVRVDLRGPRRANFDVQIVVGGKVQVRSRRAGSRDRLVATDCQVRSFGVRVVRRSGAGRFRLRIRTPG